MEKLSLFRKLLDGPSESENRPWSQVCKMREQEGVLSKKKAEKETGDAEAAGQALWPQGLSPRAGPSERQFFAACSQRHTISSNLPMDPDLVQKVLVIKEKAKPIRDDKVRR